MIGMRHGYKQEGQGKGGRTYGTVVHMNLYTWLIYRFPQELNVGSLNEMPIHICELHRLLFVLRMTKASQIRKNCPNCPNHLLGGCARQHRRLSRRADNCNSLRRHCCIFRRHTFLNKNVGRGDTVSVIHSIRTIFVLFELVVSINNYTWTPHSGPMRWSLRDAAISSHCLQIRPRLELIAQWQPLQCRSQIRVELRRAMYTSA
ncbi:hypothetical protein B0H34DRAFT_42395 [Crassisporium funariophilum]|nr:hypothetical protein B0H34DRAFT_42395 [Crassisporium funariophilum]